MFGVAGLATAADYTASPENFASAIFSMVVAADCRY
jgi:hypothetical protein